MSTDTSTTDPSTTDDSSSTTPAVVPRSTVGTPRPVSVLVPSPRADARLHGYTKCIDCLLCCSTCPQVGLASDFLCPATITAAVRYDRDSRDHGQRERLPVLDSQHGLWDCTCVGACSTACSKGVDPAAAIQQAKAAAARSWAAEFLLPRQGERS